MTRLKDDMSNILPDVLEFWKKVVDVSGGRDNHFDLSENSWWLNNIKQVRDTVAQLEKAENFLSFRDIMLKLFKYRGMIWAQQARIVVTFIKNGNEKDLRELREIVLDVYNSKGKFKGIWISKTYNLIKFFSPESVRRYQALRQTLRNVFGELYGKLFIERYPIYNSCSRDFIYIFYDFKKEDYNEFLDAFNDLKEHYIKNVGVLTKSLPINLEIDNMFNYFDKDNAGKLFLKKTLKKKTTFSIDLIQLKGFLTKMKEDHGKEWEELWDKHQEVIEELKNKVLIGKLTKEETNKILDKVKETRDFYDLFVFVFGVNDYYADDILRNKEFINILKEVNKNKQGNEKIYENRKFLKVFKNVPKNVTGLGVSSLATWLAIADPHRFMPLWGSIKREGILNSHILGVLGISEETLNSIKNDPEEYLVFISMINYVAKKVGIDNMLEVAFYFIKSKKLISTREDISEKIEKVIHFNKEMFDRIDYLLEMKRQVILYGPVGTGKTFLAINYLRWKTEDDSNRYYFTTFHQSYSYEEFIEGFRPIEDDNGNIRYIIEDGIFKKMVLKAISEALKNYKEIDEVNRGYAEELSNILSSSKRIQNYNRYQELKDMVLNFINRLYKENGERLRKLFDNAPSFYLVIDEINRGNISRIFGELITFIEIDKRLGMENYVPAILPYSRELFGVPLNLYIIGTMNTSDRSIALLDIALRRRFAFLEIEPDPEALKKRNLIKINSEFKEEIDKLFRELGDDDFLKKLLNSLNAKLEEAKDKDHRLGHSFFINIKDLESLYSKWYTEVIPLLKEYFYNDIESLHKVLGDKFIDKRDEGPGFEVVKYNNISNEEERRKFIDALKTIIS